MPNNSNGKIAGWLLGLTLIVFAAANADEHDTEDTLIGGLWTGYFKPSGADETDIEVDVIVDSDDTSDVEMTIQMIMDPRDRFRFPASDVVADDDKISFRFGRAADMWSCELERQGNSEFMGRCIPDDASGGALPSAMSIEPPSEDDDSVEEVSDDTMN